MDMKGTLKMEIKIRRQTLTFDFVKRYHFMDIYL
jgi:hypothetical protein